MKPIAPKPFTTPKTKPKYKFKKAMPSPNRGKDPIQKGLEFFFGDKPTVKPKKKTAPASPGTVRLRNSKPVPMPNPNERKYPRGVKPVPMPKVEGNYGKPRSERALPKRMGPAGPKKKTPAIVIKPPRAKKKY